MNYDSYHCTLGLDQLHMQKIILHKFHSGDAKCFTTKNYTAQKSSTQFLMFQTMKKKNHKNSETKRNIQIVRT